jgi:hypothetical protein
MERECAGALKCSVRTHVTYRELSLSDNKIPDSMDVKRQAVQGGSTAHAAPAVFFPFQKHSCKTSRNVHFLWSNGAKCWVKILV